MAQESKGVEGDIDCRGTKMYRNNLADTECPTTSLRWSTKDCQQPTELELCLKGEEIGMSIEQ